MTTVAFGCAGGADYPHAPPFHPSEDYPEVPFPERARQPNHAYAAVRDALLRLGLDEARAGTGNWNPLGALIKPGHHVVIKPNFIFHANLRGTDYRPVVTHASVLRAVTDYVLIALQGRGSVAILEAPNPNTEFERVVAAMRVDTVLNFYREKGAPVELRDLRTEQVYFGLHTILRERLLPGDPHGSVRIDLGEASEFTDLPGGYDRLYGTYHNRRETCASKRPGVGVYEVHRSYLRADVVISLAKLKTHKKTGVTLALKNFIGLGARKNLMPHYRIGSPLSGGDEFPSDECHPLVRRLKDLDWAMRDHLLQNLQRPRLYLAAAALPVYLRRAIARRATRNGYPLSEIEWGNWYGNDTLWRTVLDLNKIIRYADVNGVLHPQPQRRYLAIIDGIVAGEGEGPLSPDPREEGVVVAGIDPVAVDIATTRWMGFDEQRIPMLARALSCRGYPLTELATRDDIQRISISSPAFTGPLALLTPVTPSFRPAPGWLGHIEPARATPLHGTATAHDPGPGGLEAS
jgi:uncharacterized protein (DUF362 family)